MHVCMHVPTYVCACVQNTCVWPRNESYSSPSWWDVPFDSLAWVLVHLMYTRAALLLTKCCLRPETKGCTNFRHCVPFHLQTWWAAFVAVLGRLLIEGLAVKYGAGSAAPGWRMWESSFGNYHLFSFPLLLFFLISVFRSSHKYFWTFKKG